jgi:hypothetical protein
VLIDRTLTVAHGALHGARLLRGRNGAAVSAPCGPGDRGLAIVTIPAAVHEIVVPSVPDSALRHLGSVVRPGTWSR